MTPQSNSSLRHILMPAVEHEDGYETGNPSNWITSLPSYVKIGQLAQNFKWGHKDNSMLFDYLYPSDDGCHLLQTSVTLHYSTQAHVTEQLNHLRPTVKASSLVCLSGQDRKVG
jgi:hypothetical protein